MFDENHQKSIFSGSNRSYPGNAPGQTDCSAEWFFGLKWVLNPSWQIVSMLKFKAWLGDGWWCIVWRGQVGGNRRYGISGPKWPIAPQRELRQVPRHFFETEAWHSSGKSPSHPMEQDSGSFVENCVQESKNESGQLLRRYKYWMFQLGLLCY